VSFVKRELMDILACPIDKHHPLELHIFEEKEGIIVEGIIVCTQCSRWYPIRDEVPELLPDDIREEKRELEFLRRWRGQVPPKVLSEGKPFNLKEGG